jgi:hypothetical protein
MPRASALPFQISRSDDVIAGGTVTTTTVTVDGLLRLTDSELIVQWRLARTVNTVGRVIREDTELESVREVTVPITGLASAVIRAGWWPWSRSSRLILTAADLRNFESISGPDGLRLEHPAQLVLRIRPSDRVAAQEFAADVEMAVADQAMRDSVALEGRTTPRVNTGASPVLPSTVADNANSPTTEMPPR